MTFKLLVYTKKKQKNLHSLLTLILTIPAVDCVDLSGVSVQGFFSVSSPHGVLFLPVLSGAHLCIPLFITHDLFSTAGFNVRHL